jgi:hypothetical protein
MLRIIELEIGRLVVSSEDVALGRDDLKKFDTLVKDFVALKNRLPKAAAEESETEDDIAKLIAIADVNE